MVRVQQLACLLSLALSTSVTALPPPDRNPLQVKRTPWDPWKEECSDRFHIETFSYQASHFASPADKPFPYNRYGLTYHNIPWLHISEGFQKGMVTTEWGESNSPAGAICSHVTQLGRCNGQNVAMISVQNQTQIHSFQVGGLDFFCVDAKKNHYTTPVPCVLEAYFIRASTDPNAPWDIEKAELQQNYTRIVGSYDVGGSWGDPPARVTFPGLPLLWAFFLHIGSGTDRNAPGVTLDTVDSAEQCAGWLSNNNDNNVTGYIDNLLLRTHQCEFDAPPRNNEILDQILDPWFGKVDGDVWCVDTDASEGNDTISNAATTDAWESNHTISRAAKNCLITGRGL